MKKPDALFCRWKTTPLILVFRGAGNVPNASINDPFTIPVPCTTVTPSFITLSPKTVTLSFRAASMSSVEVIVAPSPPSNALKFALPTPVAGKSAGNALLLAAGFT